MKVLTQRFTVCGLSHIGQPPKQTRQVPPSQTVLTIYGVESDADSEGEEEVVNFTIGSSSSSSMSSRSSSTIVSAILLLFLLAFRMDVSVNGRPKN